MTYLRTKVAEIIYKNRKEDFSDTADRIIKLIQEVVPRERKREFPDFVTEGWNEYHRALLAILNGGNLNDT
jgi:hypothetical protein